LSILLPPSTKTNLCTRLKPGGLSTRLISCALQSLLHAALR
jgi:hypothetical protein